MAAMTTAHLSFSTLHSSKGLEYDQVYLLDIFDGILPSKVIPNESSVEEVKEYEEARRLFYVGMTRAKEQLHVFRCHKIESAFIREVASSLPVEQIEPDSIFASFLENLCGRSYTHKEKGKGQVIAQSGQLLLVENENTELDLRTIFELYDKRKVITLKEVKTQLKPEKKKSLSAPGPRSFGAQDPKVFITADLWHNCNPHQIWGRHRYAQ